MPPDYRHGGIKIFLGGGAWEGGLVSVNNLNNFYKELKSKNIEVSEIFFIKNPNLKKKN